MPRDRREEKKSVTRRKANWFQQKGIKGHAKKEKKNTGKRWEKWSRANWARKKGKVKRAISRPPLGDRGRGRGFGKLATYKLFGGGFEGKGPEGRGGANTKERSALASKVLGTRPNQKALVEEGEGRREQK